MDTTMSRLYTTGDCLLTQLAKISDVRGNLTYIEGKDRIPFDISRVYYIYDVPAGSQRAGHAHQSLFQLLIAVAGSFDVHLDDGVNKRSVTLNRPYEGLLITPMVWRIIDNFSSGAVCLALASATYDESSYYRDYNQFMVVAEKNRQSNPGNPISNGQE
jgi:hypothetical protein